MVLFRRPISDTETENFRDILLLRFEARSDLRECLNEHVRERGAEISAVDACMSARFGIVNIFAMRTE